MNKLINVFKSCLYIYIYIYIERERERGGEGERERGEREREREGERKLGYQSKSDFISWISKDKQFRMVQAKN